MSDPYKLLGVDYEAEDAAIKKAYYALARKYHPDNFADDPQKAELANRRMREINAAYEQIEKDRAAGIRGAAAYAERAETPRRPAEEPSSSRPAEEPRYRREEPQTAPFVGYAEVRRYINNGHVAFAEAELRKVPTRERRGEWHYLSGVIYLQKRYLHDAIREIHAACRADPKNPEYKKARDELNARMSGEPRRAPAEDRKKQKKKGFCSSPCADCCFGAVGLEDRKL